MNFEIIEKKLGYCFKNKQLLLTAFCHSSYANANKIESNERLEFLGDSVLNFITSNYLFQNVNSNEGDLSKIRAYIVSSDNLSAIIHELDILKYLKSNNFNVESSQNVACDLFEAILGAIYLDGGLSSSEKFVNEKLKLDMQSIKSIMDNHRDYKTDLQEYFQQFPNTKIEYVLQEKQGPAHKPTFKVALLINGEQKSAASALSKKQAENEVAKTVLENINKN